MSLITCCPSCGTKFRVVADQLRISDGWVRCGRCQEVFDATQALEEVQPATPAPVPPPPAPAAPQTPAAPAPRTAFFPSLHEVHPAKVDAASAPASAPVPQAAPQPAPAPAPDVALPPLEFPPAPAASAAAAAPGYELPVPPEMPQDDVWLDTPVSDGTSIAQRLQSLHAPQEPRLEPEEELQAALPAEEDLALVWSDALHAPASEEPETLLPEEEEAAIAAQVAGDASAFAAAAPDEAEPAAQEEVPGFVKQAQRKAWWNKPVVRFVMGMLIIFLPIALVLQIAVHERSTLVAWKPQWRPAMEVLCVVLRCEIPPRRDIAAVVLTGSSFHQTAQPNHYELGLSIQNQDDLAVATPALELTLTDTHDQVLVRKIFTPQEIGAPAELGPHSEWNGVLPLRTQGLHLPVSGYRVMAFYP